MLRSVGGCGSGDIVGLGGGHVVSLLERIGGEAREARGRDLLMPLRGLFLLRGSVREDGTRGLATFLVNAFWMFSCAEVIVKCK